MFIDYCRFVHKSSVCGSAEPMKFQWSPSGFNRIACALNRRYGIPLGAKTADL
jgi:hypothetical protein